MWLNHVKSYFRAQCLISQIPMLLLIPHGSMGWSLFSFSKWHELGVNSPFWDRPICLIPFQIPMFQFHPVNPHTAVQSLFNGLNMVDSIIQDLFGSILPRTLAATTAIRAFMLTPRRAKVLVSCICMSFSHQNGWFTIKTGMSPSKTG